MCLHETRAQSGLLLRSVVLPLGPPCPLLLPRPCSAKLCNVAFVCSATTHVCTECVCLFVQLYVSSLCNCCICSLRSEHFPCGRQHCANYTNAAETLSPALARSSQFAVRHSHLRDTLDRLLRAKQPQIHLLVCGTAADTGGISTDTRGSQIHRQVPVRTQRYRDTDCILYLFLCGVREIVVICMAQLWMSCRRRCKCICRMRGRGTSLLIRFTRDSCPTTHNTTQPLIKIHISSIQRGAANDIRLGFPRFLLIRKQVPLGVF